LIDRQEGLVNNRKAVFYSLITTGETLMPIIEMMFSWGTKRLEKLQIDDTTI